MAKKDKISTDVSKQARANFERAVGEALLFLSSHPLYEQLFLEEIKERILTPMAIKQYRLIHNKHGMTIGFITWAMVDEKTATQLNQQKENDTLVIDKTQWNCGDQFLVVDTAMVNPADIKPLVEKIQSEVTSPTPQPQKKRKIIH